MVEAVRAVGAEPVLFPVIRIAEPDDGGAALRAVARTIDRFDWIVLGSANAAARILAVLEEGKPAGLAAVSPRWACVGPGTAAVLREAGVEPALIAERHVAEGLVDALAEVDLAGARVLLPQAADARAVLADGLRFAGADVHVVQAYRTLPDARGAAQMRERLGRGEIGVVTFTSSSTVERFVEAVGRNVGGALVAAIGPVTATTARAEGLEPAVIARVHTVEGLVEAVVEHHRNPDRSKQG